MENGQTEDCAHFESWAGSRVTRRPTQQQAGCGPLLIENTGKAQTEEVSYTCSFQGTGLFPQAFKALEGARNINQSAFAGW